VEDRREVREKEGVAFVRVLLELSGQPAELLATWRETALAARAQENECAVLVDDGAVALGRQVESAVEVALAVVSVQLVIADDDVRRSRDALGQVAKPSDRLVARGVERVAEKDDEVDAIVSAACVDRREVATREWLGERVEAASAVGNGTAMRAGLEVEVGDDRESTSERRCRAGERRGLDTSSRVSRANLDPIAGRWVEIAKPLTIERELAIRRAFLELDPVTALEPSLHRATAYERGA